MRATCANTGPPARDEAAATIPGMPGTLGDRARRGPVSQAGPLPRLLDGAPDRHDRGPMRRVMGLCRAGIAGGAAIVLLTACGGGSSSESSATTTAAGGSAEETTASGDSDFCARAADIDQRVDAALSDLGDDPSIADAFRELGEELRAIEPPEEIAADWQTQADGLDQIADALADLDITDPEALARLEEITNDLSTASDNVETYLRDECGL
jgi:hypothetical protein